ncbi:Sulfotransferase domain protein [Posidoniimonas corsicana]|uniref:Sulfotransferase domain protein n=1 Tax=Posidoniimonas corsicana TaxID=1938618 RepID=A0A5C5VDE6_9BACT|nr:Sulfotransferase domain protein [Posidoniimonas corsicana]
MGKTLRTPDFLVIGAMKSGTTTLFRDLDQHPRVFFPDEKEPNSLSSDDVLTPRGLKAYLKLFRAAPTSALCGEASTMYTMSPMYNGAPGRALKVIGPDLRVIYIVRNVIGRCVSHYNHWLDTGRVSGDIDSELRRESHYVDFSRYATQIERWTSVFPTSQVMCVGFEQYSASRCAGAAKVFSFLGLEPVKLASTEVWNSRAQRRTPMRLAGWFANSAIYRKTLRRAMSGDLRRRLGASVSYRKEANSYRRPSAETVEYLHGMLKKDAGVFRETWGIKVLGSLEESISTFAS